MFRSVFRPYGPVWNFLNNITDALGLSLLWCLCSLPIVTIGPATTALYDAAVRGMRYGQEQTYRRFFRTFRKELKTGICVTLLWGVVLLFGIYVLSLLRMAGEEDTRAAVAAGAYMFLMLLPLSAFCWSALIQSRFANGFRTLTVTALRFLPAHPLASLLIAAICWGTCWFVVEYPIALTFAPAVCVLVWSIAAEPVFRKYGGGLETPKEN